MCDPGSKPDQSPHANWFSVLGNELYSQKTCTKKEMSVAEITQLQMAIAIAVAITIQKKLKTHKIIVAVPDSSVEKTQQLQQQLAIALPLAKRNSGAVFYQRWPMPPENHTLKSNNGERVSIAKYRSAGGGQANTKINKMSLVREKANVFLYIQLVRYVLLLALVQLIERDYLTSFQFVMMSYAILYSIVTLLILAVFQQDMCSNPVRVSLHLMAAWCLAGLSTLVWPDVSTQDDKNYKKSYKKYLIRRVEMASILCTGALSFLLFFM